MREGGSVLVRDSSGAVVSSCKIGVDIRIFSLKNVPDIIRMLFGAVTSLFQGLLQISKRIRAGLYRKIRKEAIQPDHLFILKTDCLCQVLDIFKGK